jgi:hypothetical protein
MAVNPSHLYYNWYVRADTFQAALMALERAMALAHNLQ